MGPYDLETPLTITPESTTARQPTETPPPLPLASADVPAGNARRSRLEANADAAAASSDGHLGSESPKIVAEAAHVGEKRLVRPAMGHAITSFAGGMSVSFGAIAMAAAAAAVGGTLGTPSIGQMVGALFFPIGFVILLIGKTELFTENFLIPVVAVIKHRGTHRQLARLWAIALAFNLLGALLFAFLVSRPGVLDANVAEQLVALAQKKVSEELSTAFVKAIFAGWLMTTLTWLLIAARGMVAQLMIIWCIATMIVLAGFNHVVISASETFMGMMLGGEITVGDWFGHNFLPALGGNLVGGVVFVTLLHYWQSLYHTPITDTETMDEAIEI